MSEWFAYVGCRTSRERQAIGEGISLFHVAGSGAWTLVEVTAGLENPSWLSVDAGRGVLYAAHGDRNEVSAFRIDRGDGRLSRIGCVHGGWRNPVHLAIAPSGRFLVVTNHVATADHRSGLASIAIRADGSLGGIVDLLPFEGAVGPHRIEQPFPKPHQAVFDPSGRWLVVPDKGTNALVVTGVDADGRFGAPVSPVATTRETAGPRHVAFHPGGRFAYVVDELDSTILACRFDADRGTLSPVRYLSAVRPSCVIDSRGAEIAIHPDGRTVYASNRGDDTVGAFAVDADGLLAPLGWAATGRTPRFFLIHPDGDALIVADEEDHDLVRHPIDRRTGAVGAGRRVAQVGSPTCIVMIPRG